MGRPPVPGRAEGVEATPSRPAPAGPAQADPPREQDTQAVILVVLDGVRWQEVFDGVDPGLARREGLYPGVHVPADALMPNLHRSLILHGAALGATGYGSSVRATGPNYVSLPGYTEIFTGRAPRRCADNRCEPTREPTIVDELNAGSTAPGEEAIVIASWESIDRAATSGAAGAMVSAGRHHGRGLHRLREEGGTRALLDEGAAASCAPGFDDFRPDRFTAKVALRVLVTRRPRFLFVGLGEPDEYAHRGSYGGYLNALRAADQFLGDLVTTLDAMGEAGRRTSIFVTTDHGRSERFVDHGGGAPESGRVWLVASGAALPSGGLTRASKGYHLADIAPTLRVLLRLPPDLHEDAGQPIAELLGAPNP